MPDFLAQCEALAAASRGRPCDSSPSAKGDLCTVQTPVAEKLTRVTGCEPEAVLQTTDDRSLNKYVQCEGVAKAPVLMHAGMTITNSCTIFSSLPLDYHPWNLQATARFPSACCQTLQAT